MTQSLPISSNDQSFLSTFSRPPHSLLGSLTPRLSPSWRKTPKPNDERNSVPSPLPPGPCLPQKWPGKYLCGEASGETSDKSGVGRGRESMVLTPVF